MREAVLEVIPRYYWMLFNTKPVKKLLLKMLWLDCLLFNSRLWHILGCRKKKVSAQVSLPLPWGTEWVPH